MVAPVGDKAESGRIATQLRFCTAWQFQHSRRFSAAQRRPAICALTVTPVISRLIKRLEMRGRRWLCRLDEENRKNRGAARPGACRASRLVLCRLVGLRLS